MSKINVNGNTADKTTTSAPVGSDKAKAIAPETSKGTDGTLDQDAHKAAQVQTPDNANVMPANEFGDEPQAQEDEGSQGSNLSDKDVAYLKGENPQLSKYSNKVTDSARPGDPSDVTFSRELQSLVNKYQQHASYTNDSLVSDMQSVLDAVADDSSSAELHEKVTQTSDGMTILQRQHGSDSTNTDNSLHRPVKL